MKLLPIIAMLLIPVVAMAEFTGSLVMTGSLADAKGASGATWTYSGTDDAVVYSLYGRIWVPNTAGGTYPAVIVNHGFTGSSDNMDDVGGFMRTNFGIGMIAIACELTHNASDANCPDVPGDPVEPDCEPGDTGVAGASTPNYQRIQKTFEVLQYFTSESGWSAFIVDTNRVAIHGHSAGAYSTTGTLDLHPTTYKVASHTGGGYEATESSNWTPTEAECDGITTPYSLNHGDNDATVPKAWDTALAAVLDGPYELNIMTETDCDSHSESKTCATMFANVEAWYTTYGMFDTSTCTGVSLTGVAIQ